MHVGRWWLRDLAKSYTRIHLFIRRQAVTTGGMIGCVYNSGHLARSRDLMNCYEMISRAGERKRLACLESVSKLDVAVPGRAADAVYFDANVVCHAVLNRSLTSVKQPVKLAAMTLASRTIPPRRKQRSRFGGYDDQASAIDPAKNIRRFYRLDTQPDLFGGVFLMKEWGRIGSRGPRGGLFRG